MAKYMTRVDGIEREIDAPTGDYRLVCAMAVAMADAWPLPLYVRIWCPELVPNYGPYTYRVQNDEAGNLVVKAVA